MGLFDKFFSKQKSLVGLDIGSSCVKLIELKPVGKTGTEFKLTKAGMEMLPPEAIVDGAIMDSGAIVDAIKTGDSAASEAAIRNHVRRAQQTRIKLLLQNG